MLEKMVINFEFGFMHKLSVFCGMSDKLRNVSHFEMTFFGSVRGDNSQRCKYSENFHKSGSAHDF